MFKKSGHKIYTKKEETFSHNVSSRIIWNQHFNDVPSFQLHVSCHNLFQRHHHDNVAMRKNRCGVWGGGGVMAVRTRLAYKVGSTTLWKCGPRYYWSNRINFQPQEPLIWRWSQDRESMETCTRYGSEKFPLGYVSLEGQTVQKK